MKIVDRKAFLKMPAGTIAAKYEPCVFGDLFVKGESLSDDFFLTYLTNEIDTTGSYDMGERLLLAEDGEFSVRMSFDTEMRDGCFDEDQLFAVWEMEDVVGLIARLGEIIADSGTVVADLHGAMGGEDSEADANLMAAAPEMLEALKTIVHGYDVDKEIGELPTLLRRDVNKARRAITKATGSRKV